MSWIAGSAGAAAMRKVAVLRTRERARTERIRGRRGRNGGASGVGGKGETTRWSVS